MTITTAPQGQDRFHLAVFAVEFEEGQLWWTGPVAFINIKIVAETQDLEWCNT